MLILVLLLCLSVVVFGVIFDAAPEGVISDQLRQKLLENSCQPRLQLVKMLKLASALGQGQGSGVTVRQFDGLFAPDRVRYDNGSERPPLYGVNLKCFADQGLAFTLSLVKLDRVQHAGSLNVVIEQTVSVSDHAQCEPGAVATIRNHATLIFDDQCKIKSEQYELVGVTGPLAKVDLFKHIQDSVAPCFKRKKSQPKAPKAAPQFQKIGGAALP